MVSRTVFLLVWASVTVCLPVFLQAQTTLGAYVSPLVSIPLYESDGSVPPGVEEAIREVERYAPGFAGGLVVRRPLGTHWQLQTGIGYLYAGIGYREEELQFGNGDPDAPLKGKLTKRNTFVEVPTHVYWTPWHKDAEQKVFFLAGSSLLFNVDNWTRQRLTFADGRVEVSKHDSDDHRYRKTNFSIDAGVGYEESISDEVALSMALRSRMSMLTLWEMDVPLNRRLLTLEVVFTAYLR